MAATVLSNPNSQLFDPIRKRWVRASAEERVRQDLIQRLLAQGVSSHHILVEVALDRLPTGAIPSCRAQRRADLLVAHFSQGTFTPLMLVECKAHPPTDAALGQLLSYQSVVQSRWLVLASPGRMWVADTFEAFGSTSHPLWTHELPDLFNSSSAMVRQPAR